MNRTSTSHYSFLERGQRLSPESIEVLAQRINALGIDGLHTAGSGGSIRDEIGPLEHTEVLGNRGAADGEFGGEFADRQGAFEKAREDRPAGRIPQGVELGFLVRCHLR